MLIGLVALVMLCAVLAPRSALGRLMIARPARALAGMTLSRATLSILAGLILLGFVMFAPEMTAVFGLVDLGVVAEVTAAILLVSAGAGLSRMRAAVNRLRRRGLPAIEPLRRVAARARRGGRRSTPRPRDDPDSEPAWVFA